MKIIKYLGLFLPMMLLLSCSERESITDSPIDDTEIPGDAGFYIQLQAYMPGQNSSRASDDNYTKEDGDSFQGTQGAASNESQLDKADIYFWNGKKNSEALLLKLTADKIDIKNNVWTLKAKVELEQMYVLASQPVKVFIVGNPDKVSCTMSYTNLPDAATFPIEAIASNPIGDFGTDGKGKVLPLVTNSEHELDLTRLNVGSGEEVIKALKALFTKQTNGEYVYNATAGNTSKNITGLGTIDLERAVARIDYKDADRGDDTELKGYAENVYPLNDEDKHTLKLYSMQVFNVNKESYLFRHSITGSKTDAFGETDKTIGLFGIEKGSDLDKYNWMASPFWEKTERKADFLNPLDEEKEINGNYGSIKLTDLFVSGRKTTDNTYYSWCYVSENTIPTSAQMFDDALPANATGIAFTFLVCKDKTGTPVEKQGTSTEGDILTLTMPSNHPTQANWYKELSYDATNGGYFLTYLGFIKHNDAASTVVEEPSEEDEEEIVTVTYPAPMKYAVVRNNVYQLSARKITTLPDPEEPKSFFINLDIKVLAWTLRQSEYEF